MNERSVWCLRSAERVHIYPRDEVIEGAHPTHPIHGREALRSIVAGGPGEILNVHAAT